MNRLQTELHRLYVPQGGGGQGADPDQPALIDARGQVRAMVLELARPADWGAIAKVWNGVQVDLELPAPAIAVNGIDGYQLWFSLAQPVPTPQAIAFLDALRLCYLGDVKAQRLAWWPTVEAGSPLQAVHARAVPAPQGKSGLWSAFVAQDLAPMFTEEPWLDLPPNPDGQANLLARLGSIQTADFQLALERLRPAAAPVAPPPARAPAAQAVAGPDPLKTPAAPPGAGLGPKRFLIDVMNDDSLDMRLRIEAAKALLPYVNDPPQP